MLRAGGGSGEEAFEEAAVYEITIDYTFSNDSGHPASNVEASIYLFDNWSGWTEQRVLSEQIAVEGVLVRPQIYDEEDNRWARIDLGSLGPGESKTIRVRQVVKVSSVYFDIDPSRIENDVPPELQQYTRPVAGLFESDDPRVVSLVEEITEGAGNAYEMARRIFDWIVKNVEYRVQQDEHSALYAVLTRTGDCTEFSNLFVAMARAAGIPAKIVSGNGFLPLYSISGESVDFDDVGHAWAIFYLPGYGWIPADGTWPQGRGSFAELSYEHITGAVTGGENVVRNGRIVWPGPGQASVRYTYTKPRIPNIAISTSGTLAPLMLVELDATTAAEMGPGGTLDFIVRVRNRGIGSVSRVRVLLEFDADAFEAVRAENTKEMLVSGEEWMSVLTLRALENAYEENHLIVVRAVYDSEFEGASKTYAAKTELLLQMPPKPLALILDYESLLLLLALAVSVGALAGALARRRG